VTSVAIKLEGDDSLKFGKQAWSEIVREQIRITLAPSLRPWTLRELKPVALQRTLHPIDADKNGRNRALCPPSS